MANIKLKDRGGAETPYTGVTAVQIPDENGEPVTFTIPASQHKTVDITQNGTQTITPDTGYDSMSAVEVTTDVQPNLQEKTELVGAHTPSFTVTPDEGYDGLSSVEVTCDIFTWAFCLSTSGVFTMTGWTADNAAAKIDAMSRSGCIIAGYIGGELVQAALCGAELVEDVVSALVFKYAGQSSYSGAVYTKTLDIKLTPGMSENGDIILTISSAVLTMTTPDGSQTTDMLTAMQASQMTLGYNVSPLGGNE